MSTALERPHDAGPGRHFAIPRTACSAAYCQVPAVVRTLCGPRDAAGRWARFAGPRRFAGNRRAAADNTPPPGNVLGPSTTAAGAESPVPARPKIDFGRQIQPILARRCFACHGPDKAEGGLRLSDHDMALSELDSGERAIVPGNVDQSELCAASPQPTTTCGCLPRTNRSRPSKSSWCGSGSPKGPPGTSTGPINPCGPRRRPR